MSKTTQLLVDFYDSAKQVAKQVARKIFVEPQTPAEHSKENAEFADLLMNEGRRVSVNETKLPVRTPS